jgi:hypothetical protein
LRARLNTNCKGYARTEAQSFKRNAGILSYILYYTRLNFENSFKSVIGENKNLNNC